MLLAFHFGADCSRREQTSTDPTGFTLLIKAPGKLGEDPPNCPSHLCTGAGAGLEAREELDSSVTGPPDCHQVCSR